MTHAPARFQHSDVFKARANTALLTVQDPSVVSCACVVCLAEQGGPQSALNARVAAYGHCHEHIFFCLGTNYTMVACMPAPVGVRANHQRVSTWCFGRLCGNDAMHLNARMHYYHADYKSCNMSAWCTHPSWHHARPTNSVRRCVSSTSIRG